MKGRKAVGKMRGPANQWLRGSIALALCLTGCATNPAARSRDPLYGDRIPAVATEPYPAGRQTNPNGTASAGVPPVNRGVRGDHRLAIDDSPSSPSSPGAEPQPVRSSTQAHSLGWDQARRMLRDRGVDWQHLERRDGQWHFKCSVPNPDNPNLSRHYEASAVDELGAIQVVLEKMDADR